MPKHPATPERCIELWLQYLEERKRSPKTLKGYKFAATQAVKIFRTNGRVDHPCQWKEKDLLWIRAYWERGHMRLDGTKSKPLAVKSIKGYMTVISLLAAHYGNDVGKKAKFRYEQDVRPNVEWYEFDVIKKILSAPMTPFQRAAIHFMAQLAWRRVECVRLKLNMIEWNKRTIVVDGKGHKLRSVPFHRETECILGAWLKERARLREDAIAYARKHHRTFVDSDYVLVFKKGPGIYAYSEHGSGFDKEVTGKLSKQLGMRITNHALRRTWGREVFYRGNAKLLDIGKVYGHSSEAMTELYIGIDEKRIAETMEKTPY